MKKVFIIEDDIVFIRVMGIKFSREGYKIKFADLDKNIVMQIRAEKPDVIILDLILMQSNGMEILKEINDSQDLQNTPVVVVSVLNSKDDIKKAHDLGAIAYLPKAESSMHKVIDAIKEVLK